MPSRLRPRPARPSTAPATRAWQERPPVGTIRVLFAFNPRRTAILLIGGEKRGRWQELYRHSIPIADALLDEHLAELEDR
jgi:hypothetical protein